MKLDLFMYTQKWNTNSNLFDRIKYQVYPVKYIYSLRGLTVSDYELYFNNNDPVVSKLLNLGCIFKFYFYNTDDNYVNNQWCIIDEIEKDGAYIKVTGRDALACWDYIDSSEDKTEQKLSDVFKKAFPWYGAVTTPDAINVYNDSSVFVSEIGKSLYEANKDLLYDKKIYHAYRDNFEIYFNKLSGVTYGTRYDTVLNVYIYNNDLYYNSSSIRDGAYMHTMIYEETTNNTTKKLFGTAYSGNRDRNNGSGAQRTEKHSLNDSDKQYTDAQIENELKTSAKNKVIRNTLNKLSSLSDSTLSLHLMKNYRFIYDYSINSKVKVHLADGTTKNYYIAEVQINNNIVSNIKLNAL